MKIIYNVSNYLGFHVDENFLFLGKHLCFMKKFFFRKLDENEKDDKITKI